MSSPHQQSYSSSKSFDGSVDRENAKDNQEVPSPPKAPRSAFMCFTDAKKEEIKQRFGVTENDDLLKLVAAEWRRLSDNERAYWDEEARNDKVRFVREKSEYKGPWNVPKRRAKKHPLAPKRPMSAFLKFSQKRRAQVKAQNPDMSNTDVSRLLGEMWRNASASERAPYVEQEERERAAYKDEIKKWREEQAKADARSRTTHRAVKTMVEQPRRQEPLYDYFGEPCNYEPIRIHSREDAFDRPEQRVFRPYNPQHSNDQSCLESEKPRPRVFQPFNAQFNNGPYAGYDRPTRSGFAFAEAERLHGVSRSSSRIPDGKSHYNRSPHFPENGQKPFGYYHHP